MNRLESTRARRRDLMSPRFTPMLISVFASSALLLTSAAGAAPKKTKAETAKEQADKDAAAKEKADKDAALVADAEAGSSPVEQPGKTYYGVGLRYRGIIVPKF